MTNGTRNNSTFLVPLVFVFFSLYNLPPVQQRFGRKVVELMARLKYALFPPEKIVFVRQGNDIWATPNETLPHSQSKPSPIASTATPSIKRPVSPPTPTATLKPIPNSAQLDGFWHEYQAWKLRPHHLGDGTILLGLEGWSASD